MRILLVSLSHPMPKEAQNPSPSLLLIPHPALTLYHDLVLLLNLTVLLLIIFYTISKFSSCAAIDPCCPSPAGSFLGKSEGQPEMALPVEGAGEAGDGAVSRVG